MKKLIYIIFIINLFTFQVSELAACFGKECDECERYISKKFFGASDEEKRNHGKYCDHCDELVHPCKYVDNKRRIAAHCRNHILTDLRNYDFKKAQNHAWSGLELRNPASAVAVGLFYGCKQLAKWGWDQAKEKLWNWAFKTK